MPRDPDNSLPILYSFRRCPYAIRARMVIAYSNVSVELREIELKNKPEELLQISAKATVPVLYINENTVYDESLDIMNWALTVNDPLNINQIDGLLDQRHPLIAENDDRFKEHLDHYKYADRFPRQEPIYYRRQAEEFIGKLEYQLQKGSYLLGREISVVDYAIFPFIRQFSLVDKSWFEQSEYVHVFQWLENFLTSALFQRVMKKYKPWHNTDDTVIFPTKPLYQL